MRMWNAPVKKMCRNHLLGEHVETHMFAGCIKRKKSLRGYIDTGLVEIHNLNKRHDILAKEMKRRKMNHKSPFPSVGLIRSGKVDVRRSLSDLRKRCSNCNF